MTEYKFPVYGTQGGGLVREIDDSFYFVEAPDCPGLTVGDKMPEEWGLVPANAAARRVFEEEEGVF